MVGVVGLGRAIECVGTYLPVAALLGMFVRRVRSLRGPPAPAEGLLPRSGRLFRTSLIRFTGITAMMQQLRLAQ